MLWARSAVSLEGVAADLVHGLKYEGWSGLAPYMGGRIERVLRPLVSRLGGPPVVVPVPTTRRRRRSRGYNQAELLASSVADRMNARFWAGIDRPGEGETQVVLHPDERLTNVRNAFVVAPSRAHEISGAHVVLIDDVLTTGATVSAVASTLIEAGADTVRVATFARALPR